MFSRNEIVSNIVSMVASNDIDAIRAYIAPHADTSAAVNTLGYHAVKFLRFLDTGIPEFSIFAKDGNVKLPFVAFSSMALATCPGMGECQTFCYSMRAWRYPAALFRQMQNSILLRSAAGRVEISMAFNAVLRGRKFKNQSSVDFRLYVDGDFSNTEDMEFWFGLLRYNPRVRAYGYSKSWEVFRAYGESGRAFPKNYILNLSSGSAYADDSDVARYMRNLEITRGSFVALRITADRKYSAIKGEYRDAGYKVAVRNAAAAADLGKVFVCPGQCGSCTGSGHACGIAKLSGIPIVIGIH